MSKKVLKIEKLGKFQDKELTVKEVQEILTELGAERPKFPIGVSIQGGEYFWKETELIEMGAKAKNHIEKEVTEYNGIIEGLERKLQEAKARRDEGISVLHNAHLIYDETVKERVKELGENSQLDISFPSIAKVQLKYLKKWDLVNWFKGWEGYEKFMQSKNSTNE